MEGSATVFTRREAMAGGLAAAGTEAFGGRDSAAAATWARLLTGPLRGNQDDIIVLPSGAGWYGNGAGKLFRTTDRGMTWAEVWSRPGTFVRALGFVDERVGFLGNIGPEYLLGVTNPEPLYPARDGGATWTPAPIPTGLKLTGVCAIHVLRTPFVNAGALDHRVTVRAGGRGAGPAPLTTSRDAGATWTSEDLGSATAMFLDISFVDESTGFICGATSADVAEFRADPKDPRRWIELARGVPRRPSLRAHVEGGVPDQAGRLRDRAEL